MIAACQEAVTGSSAPNECILEISRNAKMPHRDATRIYEMIVSSSLEILGAPSEGKIGDNMKAFRELLNTKHDDPQRAHTLLAGGVNIDEPELGLILAVQYLRRWNPNRNLARGFLKSSLTLSLQIVGAHWRQYPWSDLCQCEAANAMTIAANSLELVPHQAGLVYSAAEQIRNETR